MYRFRRVAVVLATCLVVSSVSADTGKVSEACTFEGHQLYGKIQVVNKFPDVKAKVVEHFPDLRVQIVKNFPDKCGKWQFVERFPDTKVQFVSSFPDIEIQYVENFPGRR